MKFLNCRSIAFFWFGILAVAVFGISWVGATIIDDSWVFGVNTLSEFGISDTNAKYYFNGGCLITGALVAVFGFGHSVARKNPGYTAGGIFMVIGGVFLALIGIITMNAGAAHGYVAVLAAVYLLLSMISVGVGSWISDNKLFAGITLVFVFILVAMSLVYNLAELEGYGIILAIVWFILESIRMMIFDGKT